MSGFSCLPGRNGEDFECALTDDDGGVVASAALWTTNTPVYRQGATGCIGRFRCAPERAAAFVAALEGVLRSQGCATALVPMEGNTWHTYRWAVGGSEEPPFTLEPPADDVSRAQFAAAGYDVVERYRSHVEEHVSPMEPSDVAREAELAARGVHVRTVDLSRFEDELRGIYELSLEAFSQNVLYTPIAFDDFAGMYRKVLPYLDPRLCLVAEREGKIVGFMFAMPDIAAMQRGDTRKTAIAKTLARSPSANVGGLGGLLFDRVREAIANAGYERIIHALMHVTNVSAAMSERRDGKPLREYALYGKTL